MCSQTAFENKLYFKIYEKKQFYVLQVMTKEKHFGLNGKNLSPTALDLKIKPCHVKYKGNFLTIPNI